MMLKTIKINDIIVHIFLVAFVMNDSQKIFFLFFLQNIQKFLYKTLNYILTRKHVYFKKSKKTSDFIAILLI